MHKLATLKQSFFENAVFTQVKYSSCQNTLVHCGIIVHQFHNSGLACLWSFSSCASTNYSSILYCSLDILYSQLYSEYDGSNCSWELIAQFNNCPLHLVQRDNCSLSCDNPSQSVASQWLSEWHLSIKSQLYSLVLEFHQHLHQTVAWPSLTQLYYSYLWFIQFQQLPEIMFSVCFCNEQFPSPSFLMYIHKELIFTVPLYNHRSFWYPTIPSVLWVHWVSEYHYSRYHG